MHAYPKSIVHFVTKDKYGKLFPGTHPILHKIKKEMNRLIISVLLVLFCTATFSQDGTERKVLLDGKLEMLVPAEFHQMTEMEYKLRYPNQNRKASTIFTNAKLDVTIAVDYMQQYALTTEQIPEFKTMQINAVKKAHPDMQLLENGVRPVNGKKIGYFKILTTAGKQKIFNYFIFTDLNGKVLLITFNCVSTFRTAWDKKIDALVTSLKLKY